MGFIAFPFVLRFNEKRGNHRYGIAALIIGIALLFIRSGSLYYFFSAFLILYALDRLWGKINILPLLLVAAVSPVISNIVFIWSFPIRLKLTALAGKMLAFIGMKIQVSGNLLTLDGQVFSVDPACIGLKLIITSVVLGLLIISYTEKKYARHISFVRIAAILIGILLATIFANFIRLLTLIIFHILPENPLHDVVGILSLLIYVLIPAYYIIDRIVKRQERSTEDEAKPPSKLPFDRLSLLVLSGLLTLQGIAGVQFLQPSTAHLEHLDHISIPGFAKSITPNGVLKFQNDSALIYVKPPVNFYQGSHDPRYCWQGSGYDFTQMTLKESESRNYFTAQLVQNADTLYTAWWYQSENSTTAHEWDWRKSTIRGEGRFYMINITCNDQETLNRWIDFDFSENIEFQ